MHIFIMIMVVVWSHVLKKTACELPSYKAICLSSLIINEDTESKLHKIFIKHIILYNSFVFLGYFWFTFPILCLSELSRWQFDSVPTQMYEDVSIFLFIILMTITRTINNVANMHILWNAFLGKEQNETIS